MKTTRTRVDGDREGRLTDMDRQRGTGEMDRVEGEAITTTDRGCRRRKDSTGRIFRWFDFLNKMLPYGPIRVSSQRSFISADSKR